MTVILLNGITFNTLLVMWDQYDPKINSLVNTDIILKSELAIIGRSF